MADHRLLLAVAVWAAVPATVTLADLVNFDDVGADGRIRTVAADRWRARGVVFNRPPAVFDVAAVDPFHEPGFRAIGGTALNAMLLSPVWGEQIEASFVRPGTTKPGVVTSARALFFDAEPSTELGVLEAFNSAGVLIASDSLISPITGGAVLEVVGEGIARVRFSCDESGVMVDNFMFTTPGSPECIADFDGSGAVDNHDYFAFLTAWFGELPEADVDGSGAINSSDFFVFIAAFFNGC